MRKIVHSGEADLTGNLRMEEIFIMGEAVLAGFAKE
jgi:hypothetical protein